MKNVTRPTSPGAFDPDAAAQPGSGVFGLPHTEDEAGIILVPLPFEATTSYRGGTAHGPGAIRAASAQVDLFDHQFGHVYRGGIFMQDEDARVHAWSEAARRLAAPIIQRGGAGPDDEDDVRRVNDAGGAVNAYTLGTVQAILKAGKTPGLVGGDHSTPLGAIQACAEHVSAGNPRPAAPAESGLGILHVDAHMDLRPAFEGFAWSHASIMFNVLERLPQVTCLVQVGIRDFAAGELDYVRSHKERVHTHFDLDWARRLDGGESFASLCLEALAPLPQCVYVSFDIDALDPTLCPHTGTPVPGGLSFNQASVLLETLSKSGRTVVGFDLVEVAPGPEGEPEWDANVGARVLYKLCGVTREGET